MGTLFLLPNAAWVLPVCLAVLLLAVGIYIVLYLRALAPQRGTLEWVALYDRPALTAVRLPGLRLWEVFCVLGMVIASAWISFCFIALSMGSFRAAFRELGNGTAYICGVYAFLSLVVYVLLRELTGAPSVAIILGLLPALGFVGDVTGSLLLLLCMLPLVCWLRLGPDDPARKGIAYLCLFTLACAIAMQLMTILCIPIAFLMLACLGAMIWRFHETRRADRLRQLLLPLLLMLVLWAITSIVTLALITSSAGVPLDFLRDSRFYRNALTPWRDILTLLPHFAYLFLTNPLTLILGLVGAVVSIYTARRYGYAEVLLLPAAMAGVTVLLFCGVDAVDTAAIPVLGCMTARLLLRRRPVLAWIAVGVAFAFTLAGDLLLVLAS